MLYYLIASILIAVTALFARPNVRFSPPAYLLLRRSDRRRGPAALGRALRHDLGRILHLRRARHALLPAARRRLDVRLRPLGSLPRGRTSAPTVFYFALLMLLTTAIAGAYFANNLVT